VGQVRAGNERPTGSDRRLPEGATAVTATVEFPSALEILLTREFEAPVALVFDVMTKPDHVRHHFAPYGEEGTGGRIDRRARGQYRLVFVTDEGQEMSFRGTYLEVEPPTRTVQTWIYDGWPDSEALESMELSEIEGGTMMTWRLKFADQAGRDHM